MPTNPSISLQVRPPEIADPFASAGKVLQLRDLLARGPIQAEQLKAAQMENQERGQQIQLRQKQIDDQAIINAAVQKHLVAAQPGEPPPAVAQPAPIGGQRFAPGNVASLATAGPGQPAMPKPQGTPDLGQVDHAAVADDLMRSGHYDLAAKYTAPLLKQHQEMATTQKTELDNKIAKATLISQTLQGVKDEATYQTAKQMLVGAGLDTSRMADHYDKPQVDLYIANGQKASDFLAKQKEALDESHKSLEDYEKTIQLAAPQFAIAKDANDAGIVAAQLKVIPGMHAKALDALLAAFQKGGRDAVLKVAQTAEQIYNAENPTTETGLEVAAVRGNKQAAQVLKNITGRKIATSVAEKVQGEKALQDAMGGSIFGDLNIPKGSVTVVTPDGAQHLFPNAFAAAKFRKAHNLQ